MKRLLPGGLHKDRVPQAMEHSWPIWRKEGTLLPDELSRSA